MIDTPSKVCTLLRPRRTIITSFATAQNALSNDNSLSPFERGDWVIGIATCGRYCAVAVSNGVVQVYDVASWQNTHTIPTGYHVTDISFAVSYESNRLLASTTEGRVLIYDLHITAATAPVLVSTATEVYDVPSRPSHAPQQQQHHQQPNVGSEAALCLSVGYNGAILAVGTDKARIHFYNLQTEPHTSSYLTSFVDSHQKQVTTAKFCGANNSILLTGSEDGLINVFDTTKATEEMALETVCSVQRPIRKAGLYRDNIIYCLTGSETISFWNAETGVCCYDSGDSIRTDLSNMYASSTNAAAAAAAAAGGAMPSIDYLIDVLIVEGARDAPQLLLMAGNLRGDGFIFRWTNTSIDNSSAASSLWQFQHFFSGGHAGVIRACCIISCHETAEIGNGFVTGGEDARLCVWNQMSTTSDTTKDVRLPLKGGHARRQTRLKSSSASPY